MNGNENTVISTKVLLTTQYYETFGISGETPSSSNVSHERSMGQEIAVCRVSKENESDPNENNNVVIPTSFVSTSEDVGHAPGLPYGWYVRRLQRTGGNRTGRIDTIIYSESGRRFKSKREMNNYLDMIENSGFDEEEAYRSRRNFSNHLKKGKLKQVTKIGILKDMYIADVEKSAVLRL
eukprot:CAMPEP_0172519748 /NCGR_PEP_ID=MMETSP1066-20121228/291603_1 /TAXON_ID=671091 /ORGANISM="Coscinodiscus wailesii, Strain CCMP2513" /LENGTH=179 /DNA_ID=CAMNT_0013302391 /DNA_START=103 /DNA_END=642 /DNA_ORIENTATION=-